jgi:hypothetical protein
MTNGQTADGRPTISSSSSLTLAHGVSISGVGAVLEDAVSGTYFPVSGVTCGGKPVYKRVKGDAWIEFDTGTKSWQVKKEADRGTSVCWMHSVGEATDSVQKMTGGWKAYNHQLIAINRAVGTAKLKFTQKMAQMQEAFKLQEEVIYVNNLVYTILKYFETH